MKVSELEGAELDYWVAKAKGKINADNWNLWRNLRCGEEYNPSSDWDIGGPIIEDEQITVQCTLNCPPVWRATSRRLKGNQAGDTPLIAAMRAFVASKFGDEVKEG